MKTLKNQKNNDLKVEIKCKKKSRCALYDFFNSKKTEAFRGQRVGVKFYASLDQNKNTQLNSETILKV
jgi:hypothetical protein